MASSPHGPTASEQGPWARAMRYFGAHLVPRRADNERARAIQRIFIGGLVPAMVLVDVLRGQHLAALHLLFAMSAAAWSLSSAVYLRRLRHNPGIWPGLQFSYLFLDAAMVAGAIYFQPIPYFVMMPFVPFMPMAIGVRYGERAMWAHWATLVLVLGVAIPLSPFWQHHRMFAGASMLWLVLAPVPILAVIRLIERTRAMQVERARLAAKGEFLAKVSHELRSPLQSIVAALELWEASTTSDITPTQQRIMERVRRSVGQLQTYVQDVLLVSRAEAGVLQVHPADFDVRQLVESVVGDHEVWAAEKGLMLVVSLPAQALWVHSDPSRMSQLLVNLLSNAIKYTDKGQVQVVIGDVEQDEGCFTLEVADTGRGIPCEAMPGLFEAFNRGAAPNDAASESAGLGLAVVATVCEILQGKLRVHSRPGEGTRFVVQLPLVLLSAAA